MKLFPFLALVSAVGGAVLSIDPPPPADRGSTLISRNNNYGHSGDGHSSALLSLFAAVTLTMSQIRILFALVRRRSVATILFRPRASISTTYWANTGLRRTLVATRSASDVRLRSGTSGMSLLFVCNDFALDKETTQHDHPQSDMLRYYIRIVWDRYRLHSQSVALYCRRDVH
jgi:hypothetical protein